MGHSAIAKTRTYVVISCMLGCEVCQAGYV